jgi:uncharacterized protein YjiS (DUF1127 family)
MTTSDITLRAHPLRAWIGAVLSGIGEGFVAYANSQARIGEINRLNALSDAELADLGVTRDRIPHYVFRDLFHA